MMGEATDTELAHAEELLRAAVDIGQLAVTVDPEFVADVIAELRQFRSGEWVQMPKSKTHAEAMNLLSAQYIKDNPGI